MTNATTTAATTTIADSISARFGHDGQTWEVDGDSLEQVAFDAAWRCYTRGGDTTMYIMDDASVVVVAGDMWDILTVVDGRYTDSGGGDWWGAAVDGEPTAEDGWSYGRASY
jgi:hypothetical protein